MGRVFAALLTLAVLTGCVQVAHPPAGGFTDAQSTALAFAYAERVYADDLPDDFTLILVEPDVLGDAIVECLAEQGFDSYRSMGDAVIWDGDGAMSDAESAAWLLCSTAWQAFPDETGALNEQQLGYLYDYYRESVIPCLALAGITLPDAPTRQEFIASHGNWQPALPQSETYVGGGFDLGQSAWLRSTPDGDLAARCPTWPPEWKL